MSWTKESDWLPLSNAIAQVSFWRDDLMYAEKHLAYVESYQKYNLPGYDKIHEIALRDVDVSKAGLESAKRKLDETQKRISG